jgi:hypothetical protein
MNKNTILLLGSVVLCLVVVMVINIAINSPDKETVSPRLTKDPKSARIHQHLSRVPEQASAPAEEREPKPEYEATVSNGTILF